MDKIGAVKLFRDDKLLKTVYIDKDYEEIVEELEKNYNLEFQWHEEFTRTCVIPEITFYRVEHIHNHYKDNYRIEVELHIEVANHDRNG